MSDKRRVAILTNHLACDMNTKYYSTLEKYFNSNEWEVVNDFDAELIVFSTCGFVDEKFRIVMNAVSKLKADGFPAQSIILMGCLPKTHENEVKDLFNGTIVNFGKEEELDRIINAKVPFKGINLTNVFKAPNEANTNKKEKLFNIIIEDGCLKQCTFCVVNKAHGDIKSTPLSEIENQFRKAIELGYKNICLSGTDTFAYGYDRNSNIIELIENLLVIDSNIKLYLGNLHARWLVKYSEGILSLCKRGVINSLHMVLQHVNKDMLKRMGRPENFPEFYEIIKNIKQERPDLFLNTDLIIGFHGETDEMFDELKEFVKNDSCFDSFNAFVYSDVKGAPAYNYDGKLNLKVKLTRYKELMDLIGDRNRMAAISKLNDAQTCRYRTINELDSQSETGYFFCKNTYESI